MIDATHKLPVTRQAELLDLSRSNVYYLPRPVSDVDLELMRGIDELHLNFPFAGARMLRDMLKLEGVGVGRKHVCTLMERIGIAAIYRKRNTSAPHPEHEIYQYLPRNLTVDRPNQVWAKRHQLHPDASRLRVPGGHHRLGHPPSPRAPGIDQHDRGFLRRCS
jgi:putative transposase